MSPVSGALNAGDLLAALRQAFLCEGLLRRWARFDAFVKRFDLRPVVKGEVEHRRPVENNKCVSVHWCIGCTQNELSPIGDHNLKVTNPLPKNGIGLLKF